MDDLELAWQTYEFHLEKIHELESKYLSNLKKLKILQQKRVEPTELEKEKMLQSINNCCNNLIVHYNKQIDSIADLIDIHNSGNKPSEHRETDIEALDELLDVTCVLLEEMLKYRSQIKNLFN
jgi:hypothetical protein